MSASPHVRWFADIGLDQRPEVGGKGGSLGELTRAGHAVPPGFVVTTCAFERHLAQLERAAPVRALVEALDPDDLPGIAACAVQLRARIEGVALPPEVRDAVAAAYAALCADRGGGSRGDIGPGADTGAGTGIGLHTDTDTGTDARTDAGAGSCLDADPDTDDGSGGVAVAVRSSATTEDAMDASFAGLQDTYLWVRGLADLLSRLRRCWASLYSVDSLSYRRRLGFPEGGVAMGVVVQRMVDAHAAGVMFTRSPLTGDRSVITIEGAWGLGSAVVGGEVTPDRWVIGKVTGEISVRDISDKAIRHVPAAAAGVETQPVPEAQRREPCLSDGELQVLRGIGRAVERHYGRPQDIEWAVDRRGRIYLLQSRPETVWSSKPSAPVARAADDPLRHVMNIFGGRR